MSRVSSASQEPVSGLHLRQVSLLHSPPQIMLLSTVCLRLLLLSGKGGNTHDVPADGRNNSAVLNLPLEPPIVPPVISTATKKVTIHTHHDSDHLNKHFESSQKLLKSSFVNEIFKKYSKVPKKLLTFEKTKFTKT